MAVASPAIPGRGVRVVFMLRFPLFLAVRIGRLPLLLTQMCTARVATDPKIPRSGDHHDPIGAPA
jgi:hypothetical protein